VKKVVETLVEEIIVEAAICALFLFHLRSSLVAIISLPVGVLIAFAVMRQQGINANIMSLGGIAIAIGAMLDAAIVLIENTHKHLEQWREEKSAQPTGTDYFAIIKASTTQVGPALFFSLLIITVSFLPVFALEAQEGRLFAPLAYTKTYAMAAASALSVTLVPVLCYYLVRGRIRREIDNPLNRWLIAAYQPAIRGVLKHPRSSLVLALLLLVATLYPVAQLGGEFMPALDEGDLLYMPTAQPGLSAAKAECCNRPTA
jgi:Cu(I)/Ag(I) efflux system membrane protein CusA/SilA